MADRTIIRPRAIMRLSGNRWETFGGRTGISDNHASAPWVAGGCIVVLTSGLLNPVVTDGVLACGYVDEASAASAAANPPTSLRDPSKHFPWNLRDMIFLMNITDASGNIGQANGAPTLSEAVIGASYALRRATTAAQMVDVDDTTNTLVTVVDKPALVDGIANISTTYNGLVAVKFIESKIQSVA